MHERLTTCVFALCVLRVSVALVFVDMYVCSAHTALPARVRDVLFLPQMLTDREH